MDSWYKLLRKCYVLLAVNVFQCYVFLAAREKPCKETQRYSLSAASSLVEPFVYVFHITLHKKNVQR